MAGDERTSKARGWRGRHRLASLVAGGVLLIAVVVGSALVAGVTAPGAEAATWHTKLAGSGHHGHTYGPVTLYGSRETRVRYWTAKVWEADDDGDEPGEWEYDWVKLRVIRSDTGETVKTIGPIYSPTGYRDWRTASVSLPSGAHAYKVRVSCDDARFGFKLQQSY